MSLSLIDSILPSITTIEGRIIREQMVLQGDKTVCKKRCIDQKRKNLWLGKLALLLAKETAEAILDARYRSNFDPLIKNFGCQITAKEVMQLVGTPFLYEEAAKINKLAQNNLIQLKKLQQKLPEGEVKMTAIAYNEKAGIDLSVSPEFARLVRFRMLTIVNEIILKLINGIEREVPQTNTSLLSLKDKNFRNLPLQEIVSGIQAEESVKEAQFVEQLSVKLNTSRKTLIQRLVSDRFLRPVMAYEEHSPIVSLPLNYTVESVLKTLNGIILVKNKLFLCNKKETKRIDQAEPMHVYLKMPERKVMTPEEISLVDPNQPIYVIESFIKKNTLLQQKIEDIGLMKIARANCAIFPQYASGTLNQEIDDEEARRDLQKCAEMKEALEVMEIDHMYCASMKEEL